MRLAIYRFRCDKRIPPGVLCKRRGILYFAGGLARIIERDTLKGSNVRVSIRLRRKVFSPCTVHALESSFV